MGRVPPGPGGNPRGSICGRCTQVCREDCRWSHLEAQPNILVPPHVLRAPHPRSDAANVCSGWTPPPPPHSSAQPSVRAPPRSLRSGVFPVQLPQKPSRSREQPGEDGERLGLDAAPSLRKHSLAPGNRETGLRRPLPPPPAAASSPAASPKGKAAAAGAERWKVDRTFPPFILYCFDLRPPTESEACFWYAFSVWSAMTGAAVTAPNTKEQL